MPPLLLLLIGGCGSSENGKGQSSATVREPALIPQDLTAGQLADILDIEAWTWTYRGPAPECWIEIIEEGQETMPARIPAQGSIGSEINPFATGLREGTILFYWRQTEPDGGGVLHLSVDGRGAYKYGLNSQALTFGWKAWSSQDHSRHRVGEPIETRPDEELTLLDYEASQLPEGDAMVEQGLPRLTIRLKARFPDPSAASDSDSDSASASVATTDKDSP
ncbi:hypothetical protein BH23PLA1_BH23PLA1_29020 [soil metagenome]